MKSCATVLTEIEAFLIFQERYNISCTVSGAWCCFGLGISGGMSSLMGAMITSRPEIVALLIEYGADPYE